MGKRERLWEEKEEEVNEMEMEEEAPRGNVSGRRCRLLEEEEALRE